MNNTTTTDYFPSLENSLPTDNLDALLNNLTHHLPSEDESDVLYPLGWVIPITVVYAIIFISGILGNISTCIVIARNRHLHTVTNYYLFSIAISDLLLLISGLPPEMYRIWSPENYVFGEAFCVLQGFFAETSANATVLTITAFTVERYLAICHPFLSHTMSNLSRAIKYILAIWVVALCLAAPQAIQFGVEYGLQRNGAEYSRCTVSSGGSKEVVYMEHAFEISTFLFFVGPMTLITVLYVLIAVKLRQSRKLGRGIGKKRPPATAASSNGTAAAATATSGGSSGCEGSAMLTPVGMMRQASRTAAQNRVIKMLVAVVVAFFICWAPFHAQRLLAIYLAEASEEAQAPYIPIYIALMYISGVLYFLSTTVNPLLYHIMSNKFREAFKATFRQVCKRRHPTHSRYDLPMGGRSNYSTVMTKCPPSQRHFQRSMSDSVSHFHHIPLIIQQQSSLIPNKSVAIVIKTIEPMSTTTNPGKLMKTTNNESIVTNPEKLGKPGKQIVVTRNDNAIMESSNATAIETNELTKSIVDKQSNMVVVEKELNMTEQQSKVTEQQSKLLEQQFNGKKKQQSDVKDKQQSNVKDKQQFNVKDKQQSNAKDKQQSNVKDKQQSNIKDKQQSSNYRPRFTSQTSQLTLLSDMNLLQKTPSNSNITSVNQRIVVTKNNHPNNSHHSYFHKLTRFFNIFQKKNRQHVAQSGNAKPANGRMLFVRQGSLESATISNSSLQDLEEIEFSSTDLVRYMEEVNEDIT